MNKERIRDLAVMGLLVVLCIVVYGRCLTFDSTLYDDPKIIFENPKVQAGLTWDSIRWAVLNPNLGLYMPLPTLTFMLDRELFGEWAGGYHGMTLAWHILCVCLFYWVMRRLTGNVAAVLVASILVAVHPVQAMTVNWVSARNEIMPAVCMLLSIEMYRRYCRMRNAEFGMRNGGEGGTSAEFGMRIAEWGKNAKGTKDTKDKAAQGRKTSAENIQGKATGIDAGDSAFRTPHSAFPILFFSLAVLFMFLGILCKQGIVVLPAVLLLLDYWPLGRVELSFRNAGRTLRRMMVLTVEKLPFFAVSAVGAVFAVYGKREFGMIQKSTLEPLLKNIGFAFTAYARYLGHLVFPERYIMAYSVPPEGPAWWMIAGAALLLAVLTACALTQLWKRPWVVVFWGWFVLFLFPVSGIVRYAVESIALRYLYVPAAGLFLLLGFALVELARRTAARGAGKDADAMPGWFWAALVAIGLISGGLAFRQSGFWKDGETLALRALEVTKGENAVAHNHLGVIADRRGLSKRAFAHAQKAIELEPHRNVWKANYATALNRRQRYEETLELIAPVLKEQPDSVTLLNLYGGALTGLRRFQEAEPHLRHALEIEPRHTPSLYNLSLCLIYSGREAEAKPLLEQILAIQPSHQMAKKTLEALNKGKG